MDPSPFLVFLLFEYTGRGLPLKTKRLNGASMSYQIFYPFFFPPQVHLDATLESCSGPNLNVRSNSSNAVRVRLRCKLPLAVILIAPVSSDTTTVIASVTSLNPSAAR